MAIIAKVVYGGDKRFSHVVIPSGTYAGEGSQHDSEEWERRAAPAPAGRALDAAEGIIICTVAGALAWGAMALALSSIM